MKLNDKGKMSNVSKSRLDVAIRLHENKSSSKLILVGGFSNRKAKISEAEAMKRYLIQNGIDRKNIIKEESSIDTIGNIFFLKQNILKPNRWNNLLIITSDFHMERVKIISKKILGRKYKIKFMASKAFNIPMSFYKMLGLEKSFTELTRELLDGVEDGNDAQIGNLVKKVHPLYSGKDVKELAKLSNKEIADKFGVREKTVRKIRRYVEMMARMAGKL